MMSTTTNSCPHQNNGVNGTRCTVLLASLGEIVLRRESFNGELKGEILCVKPVAGPGVNELTGLGECPRTGDGANPLTGDGAKPFTGFWVDTRSGAAVWPLTGFCVKPRTGVAV